MKEELTELLNSLRELRNQAFTEQNKEAYDQLGRAMANIIRAKEAYR